MILPASPALSADPLPMGESAGAPDRIRLTSQYIERDGRPWIPVTGELHYSRIPRSRWKQTLGQAAAGGLNSVACYVFWRYHEPEPGTSTGPETAGPVQLHPAGCRGGSGRRRAFGALGPR